MDQEATSGDLETEIDGRDLKAQRRQVCFFSLVERWKRWAQNVQCRINVTDLLSCVGALRGHEMKHSTFFEKGLLVRVIYGGLGQ